MQELLKKIEADAAARLPLPPGRQATQELARYKAFLKVETHRLKLHHRAGIGGLEICHARAAILDALKLTEADRIKPRVLSSQIILNVDDLQVQLINRTRQGMMLIAGESLYILEVEPAAYAAYAANEAEKAAEINVIDVRMTGAFGRVYLGGEQRDIDVASVAAIKAIESLSGRVVTGGRKD